MILQPTDLTTTLTTWRRHRLVLTSLSSPSVCARLAEIAHALLKLAPYDTLTMESRGLRRYIMEMLPITDWSSEAVRPALILILKRLDRMFNKIHKMPTLRCARPQALCTRSVEYDHFSLSPCECIVLCRCRGVNSR